MRCILSAHMVVLYCYAIDIILLPTLFHVVIVCIVESTVLLFTSKKLDKFAVNLLSEAVKAQKGKFSFTLYVQSS